MLILREMKKVLAFFKTGKMTADKHKFPLIIPNPKRNQNQWVFAKKPQEFFVMFYFQNGLSSWS